VGHAERIGDMKNSYKILVAELEVKSPVERPRRRWEDNIKMNFKGIGCEDVEGTIQ
jgi:hypothetical protein